MAPPDRNPAEAPGVPGAGTTTAGPSIAGLVLAAGRSSRMGSPKADLLLGGRTFLEHCVALLREGGCTSVTVVVGADAPPALPDGVAAAVNPDPGSEPIDSIRIGLAALPGTPAAAVVLPVDAPAVRADTVARLIRTFIATGASVVRPTCGGQPGHPTLFGRQRFGALSSATLPRGAESVVAAAADRIDLKVPDPAILANVNTPDDYRRLQGET